MTISERYLSAVQFVMLYKVVLIFESVDEILRCKHSNEGYYWSRTFRFDFARVSLAGQHFFNINVYQATEVQLDNVDTFKVHCILINSYQFYILNHDH